jgi:RNA polymerase sigma-70 factor (ECF subfamily)
MRRRLGIEPLTLDDDAIARIDQLDGNPAVTALHELPVDQRAAVVGRVIDERSYPELASRLTYSESVVRQRVSRGLGSLRDRMEAERCAGCPTWNAFCSTPPNEWMHMQTPCQQHPGTAGALWREPRLRSLPQSCSPCFSRFPGQGSAWRHHDRRRAGRRALAFP